MRSCHPRTRTGAPISSVLFRQMPLGQANASDDSPSTEFPQHWHWNRRNRVERLRTLLRPLGARASQQRAGKSGFDMSVVPGFEQLVPSSPESPDTSSARRHTEEGIAASQLAAEDSVSSDHVHAIQ